MKLYINESTKGFVFEGKGWSGEYTLGAVKSLFPEGTKLDYGTCDYCFADLLTGKTRPMSEDEYRELTENAVEFHRPYDPDLRDDVTLGEACGYIERNEGSGVFVICDGKLVYGNPDSYFNHKSSVGMTSEEIEMMVMGMDYKEAYSRREMASLFKYAEFKIEEIGSLNSEAVDKINSMGHSRNCDLGQPEINRVIEAIKAGMTMQEFCDDIGEPYLKRAAVAMMDDVPASKEKLTDECLEEIDRLQKYMEVSDACKGEIIIYVNGLLMAARQ